MFIKRKFLKVFNENVIVTDISIIHSHTKNQDYSDLIKVQNGYEDLYMELIHENDNITVKFYSPTYRVNLISDWSCDYVYKNI